MKTSLEDLQIGEEAEITLDDGTKVRVVRLSPERPNRLDVVHAQIMQELETWRRYLRSHAEAFM
jgi:hypothetical protein